MTLSSRPKWTPAAILSNKFKKKLHIDLKWPEMRSKVIFGHPKWPPAVILSKIKKKKFRMDLKWPEMPSKMNFGHPKWPPKKNAIECEFQTSKMADRQPKWLLDLKWPEMPSKVIFAVGHFVKKFKKRSVWR